MRIDWDEHKNKRHQAKHRVSFELAQLVFDDPHQVSVQDRRENAEERWQTLGMVDGAVVLLCCAYLSRERER